MTADLTTTEPGKSAPAPSRQLFSTLWLKVREHPERVLTPIALVLFILAWRLITLSGMLSTIILPPVEDVAGAWVLSSPRRSFPKHLGATPAIHTLWLSAGQSGGVHARPADG